MNQSETQLKSSKPFLDDLFLTTLQSLAARVDECGFCQTSFGELNDVKCYGCCHYSRDAAEAAYVLADHGLFAKAEAILDFTLNRTPDGQYYIVHAFAEDGSPLHNHIQLDTPAHAARALAKLLQTGYRSERVESCFERLVFFFDMAFEKHFHREFSLFDSGNYNEQLGGGKDAVLDLFTNGAMYGGAVAMKLAAKCLNRDGVKFDVLAQQLARGIEEHFYDRRRNLYLAVRKMDGTVMERPLNWINFYPERWYPGRLPAWSNACDYLWRDSCNCWFGREIPSGETDFMRLRTMGKVVAHFLSFAGRNGNVRQVNELLHFLVETIRKPDNLYPEWWYYRAPTPGASPYLDWFFDEFKGVWSSFCDAPASDYTIDSGNCEQISVFLAAFSEDILGVRGNAEALEVAPVLPNFSFCEYTKVVGLRKRQPVTVTVTVEGECLHFHSSHELEQLTLRWKQREIVLHQVKQALI